MFIAHSQGIAIEAGELKEFGVKIGFSESVEACYFIEIKGPALGAEGWTRVAFEDCEIYR